MRLNIFSGVYVSTLNINRSIVTLSSMDIIILKYCWFCYFVIYVCSSVKNSREAKHITAIIISFPISVSFLTMGTIFYFLKKNLSWNYSQINELKKNICGLISLHSYLFLLFTLLEQKWINHSFRASERYTDLHFLYFTGHWTYAGLVRRYRSVKITVTSQNTLLHGISRESSHI